MTAFVLCVAAAGLMPAQTQPGSIHFTDVTADCGIAFITTAGRSPSTQILEVKGGGLALIDFDNDGDQDLFIPNGATLEKPDAGPGCRLYENVGGLKFRDVTAASGLSFNRWGMGAAAGDYDADGRDDIFIACFGRNALLRNLGGGKFQDVTTAAGLDDDRWSASASFGDIDNDGDLDLYVANYIRFDPANPPGKTLFLGMEVLTGPQGLPAEADVLYENLGDGTFRDITETSGCAAVKPSYGLGSVILDFDGDGRQDIFVGNDSMKNFLFRNLGERKFRDDGVLSGIATNGEGSEQATMGIGIADVDANGRPDVFTTNFSNDTNTLHVNLDGRFFDDRTQSYGLGQVSATFLGWGCGLFDFDHDADEDLLIFNGHVYPSATRATMNSDYLQAPLLFERRGKRFERLGADAAGEWAGQAHCDRSAAFADLEGDGDIDVIVSELNGPIRVLRNDAVGRVGGAWLSVQLADPRPGAKNRRGYGSVITLTADGAPTQRRWVCSCGSFQVTAPGIAHFGLPSTVREAAIEVRWPDGHVQKIDRAAINQKLTIERPRD